MKGIKTMSFTLSDVHHVQVRAVRREDRGPNLIMTLLSRITWPKSPTLTAKYNANDDRLFINIGIAQPVAVATSHDAAVVVGFDHIGSVAWPTMMIFDRGASEVMLAIQGVESVGKQLLGSSFISIATMALVNPNQVVSLELTPDKGDSLWKSWDKISTSI